MPEVAPGGDGTRFRVKCRVESVDPYLVGVDPALVGSAVRGDAVQADVKGCGLYPNSTSMVRVDRPALVIAAARRRKILAAALGSWVPCRRAGGAGDGWLCEHLALLLRASWVARSAFMNMTFSCLSGAALDIWALTRQVLPPGRAQGRDQVTPSRDAAARGQMTHTDFTGRTVSRSWPLDQASGQGQSGQVGAAAAAGLVPDPVQVRADRADADEQLRGDLRVGAALGDQGDQLPLPGAEPAQAWRRPGLPRAGSSVSRRAYSAAVAALIAAPRCSAARARSGPSACRAARSGSSRRRRVAPAESVAPD